MVLTSGRLALVASSALLFALPLQAQRGFGAGRGVATGPRPMLFGFALECSGCTRERLQGELPVWHYTEYPRVVAVAQGGAAERAGIREGDVLMSVDGMSILSSDGARRFSSARVADNIRLTLDRGGKTIDAELSPRLGRGMLGMRGERPLREPVPRDFSGSVGDVIVDATSNEPVVATTDSLGTLTLRIGGTVVRIRPAPLFKKSKSEKLGLPKPKPEKPEKPAPSS